MQAIKEEMFFPKTRSALSRRDLLIYEEQLCADLRSFIGFESHALYFPVEDELKAYTYVPEEKKLLLPLRIKDSLLGVLLLKEVRAEEENFALLPSLVRLCLEKIHLCKRERLDERSGLLRPCFFMVKLKKKYRRSMHIFKPPCGTICESRKMNFLCRACPVFLQPCLLCRKSRNMLCPWRVKAVSA